jgi:ClpP class serine protease
VDIQEDLDSIHKRFIKVVSDGRGLSMDEAWGLGNGDVFDGPEALEKKLIDKVGFLDDVIDAVTMDLGLSDPKVIRYMRPPTLREMRMENPLDIKAYLEKWAMTPRILAIWPGQ